MEKKIENFLDKIFESMVPGVYYFSIFLGVALIALGCYLYLKNYKTRNTGIIIFIVGVIALIHGAQYLIFFV